MQFRFRSVYTLRKKILSQIFSLIQKRHTTALKKIFMQYRFSAWNPTYTHSKDVSQDFLKIWRKSLERDPKVDLVVVSFFSVTLRFRVTVCDHRDNDIVTPQRKKHEPWHTSRPWIRSRADYYYRDNNKQHNKATIASKIGWWSFIKSCRKGSNELLWKGTMHFYTPLPGFIQQ